MKYQCLCLNLHCATEKYSTKHAFYEVLDNKVSKVAKIRNRYNQVPHLTQDTNGKVTNSQKTQQTRAKRSALSHEAHINRRAQNIANTRQNKNIKDPQKKYRLGTVSKIFYWRAYTGLTAPTSPLIQMWIKTHRYLVCMKDP